MNQKLNAYLIFVPFLGHHIWGLEISWGQNSLNLYFVYLLWEGEVGILNGISIILEWRILCLE